LTASQAIVHAERRTVGGPRGHTDVRAAPARLEADRRRMSEVSAHVRVKLIKGRGRRERGEAGQSLVEFSLILFPLFFIFLGIIQFGFIFNTYVTMTNAARDAARLGTIYIYTRESGETKATNDLARNESIKSQILDSMNNLGKTSPYFATGATWTQSGDTYTNGDLTITYALPTGVTDSETRMGQQITVRATYHQDLIIPLISAFLPKDGNGRMTLTGDVTMVIN
jgi:Flp pilus assembly protein TadG